MGACLHVIHFGYVRDRVSQGRERREKRKKERLCERERERERLRGGVREKLRETERVGGERERETE